MQKKGITEWVKWAEEVKTEWKHIPSLRGKQAQRHIIILRLLTVNQELSYVEIAKRYLEGVDPDWAELQPDTKYHRYMKESANIYKRMKWLEQKQYVKKVGSTYQITIKGFFLTLALDPRLLASLSISRLKAQSFDVSENSVEQKNKLFESVWGAQEKENIFTNVQGSWAPLLSDPVLRKTMSYGLKQRFLALKINFDEVAPETLPELMFTHIGGPLKKELERFLKTEPKNR